MQDRNAQSSKPARYLNDPPLTSVTGRLHATMAPTMVGTQEAKFAGTVTPEEKK